MGKQSMQRAAVIGLLIAAAVVFPAVSSAQALVRGTLYDDGTGGPVRGTVMLVDPGTNGAVVHMVSDSVGRFELKTVSGIYQIAAVRSGYTSVLSAPIRLEAGETMTVRVPIAQAGDPVHHIGVLERTVQPSIPDRSPVDDAFARQRALGRGLQYDRTELARSTANTLGEFLQNVAGVSISDPASTSTMRMTRSAGVYTPPTPNNPAGACHVAWFIDGRRFDRNGQDALTDGLGTLPLNAIQGVAVYRGISETPPEFAEPDVRCGAIVVWTRRN